MENCESVRYMYAHTKLSMTVTSWLMNFVPVLYVHVYSCSPVQVSESHQRMSVTANKVCVCVCVCVSNLRNFMNRVCVCVV